MQRSLDKLSLEKGVIFEIESPTQDLKLLIQIDHTMLMHAATYLVRNVSAEAN